jgi:hypothetical protein
MAKGYPLLWLSGAHDFNEGHKYNKESFAYLKALYKIFSEIKNFSALKRKNDLIIILNPDKIRYYCLSNENEYLIYFNHYIDHSTIISDSYFTINLPDSFYYNAQWFDPSTSENLLTETGIINNSNFTFQIPDFKIDLALYLNISEEPTSVSQKNFINEPNRFQISQNYPNPFNNATTISYSVTAREKIRVRVFNIMGQEVERIVDEVKDAGHYKIIWNCSNSKKNEISSGIFFIKLEAGNYHQVIKTVLIK